MGNQRCKGLEVRIGISQGMNGIKRCRRRQHVEKRGCGIHPPGKRHLINPKPKAENVRSTRCLKILVTQNDCYGSVCLSLLLVLHLCAVLGVNQLSQIMAVACIWGKSWPCPVISKPMWVQCRLWRSCVHARMSVELTVVLFIIVLPILCVNRFIDLKHES